MFLNEFNELVLLEYPEWAKTYSPLLVEKGKVTCNAVIEKDGNKTVIGIYKQEKLGGKFLIKKKDGTHRKAITDTATVYVTEQEFNNNIIKPRLKKIGTKSDDKNPTLPQEKK